MTERIFNFSAGPAVLPLPVLEQAQRDLLALPGVGMSILEISHRSKTFDEILEHAQSSLRALLGLPDNYHVFVFAGRRKFAVFDGANESTCKRQKRRLYPHWLLVTESGQRS